MDLGLNGSRVLITGGSRGIGLAVAEALAAEGAAIGLVARGAEGLAAAAD
ncbi:MAG: SDR family NAD(P)-dependent oxidoreductase, partial [Streptosporangiaceae bacterium]